MDSVFLCHDHLSHPSSPLPLTLPENSSPSPSPPLPLSSSPPPPSPPFSVPRPPPSLRQPDTAAAGALSPLPVAPLSSISLMPYEQQQPPSREPDPQVYPHPVPRLPPIQLPSVYPEAQQGDSSQRHPPYAPAQFQHPQYPYCPQTPRSFPSRSSPPPLSLSSSSSFLPSDAQNDPATFEYPPPIPVAMRHPYPMSTSIRQVPHHAQHTQLQQHIISEPFVPVTPELVNKPPRRRRRPPFSYSSLIAQAILGAPEQKMTLRDIYKWIMEKYPALYKADDTGWQNTIRHNLSLNKCFKKVARTESDSASKGKGGYWTVDANYMNHFANGAFARGSIIKRKAGETSSAGSSEQSDNEGGSADVGPSGNQVDAKDAEKRLRHTTDDEDDSPGSIDDVDMMLDSPGYKRSSVSSSDDIADYPGYAQYHQPHSTIVHRYDTDPSVDSVHSRLEHAHIEHSVSGVGVVTLASEIDPSASSSPMSVSSMSPTAIFPSPQLIPGRAESDVSTIDAEVELDTPLSSSPVMRIHNILN